MEASNDKYGWMKKKAPSLKSNKLDVPVAFTVGITTKIGPSAAAATACGDPGVAELLPLLKDDENGLLLLSFTNGLDDDDADLLLLLFSALSSHCLGTWLKLLESCHRRCHGCSVRVFSI